MLNFLEKHNTANIVKDKTCFRSLDNPIRIDRFITNQPQCFQNTAVFSTDLSHFHKMAATVLKTSLSKASLKEILHRDYKNFEQDKIRYKLKNRIQNELNSKLNAIVSLKRVFVDIINEHDSFKKKFLRANYAPHMTNRLRKAIMKRSELKS